MHKKVKDYELTFNLTISDFCIQQYQLPLPIFCFKMTTIDQGLLAIICKLLLQIQMYRKKSTSSNVQQSIFMLLYALFISFPVKHTDNFRLYGRHCIGDMIAHTMI